MKKPHPNQLLMRFAHVLPGDKLVMTVKAEKPLTPGNHGMTLNAEPILESSPEPAVVQPHYTMRSFMAGAAVGGDMAQVVSNFRSRLDEGTTCPCCQRYAKRYRRSINATMAGALCALVARRLRGEDWVRAEQVGEDLHKHAAFEKVSYPHGEIGKLAFPAWGLVEAKLSDNPHKKSTGLWRATARGVAFAQGSLLVPKYLFVYDNHVDAVSDETTSIRQCFKKSFSYQELLR